MPNWETLSQPDFTVSVAYPTTTPAGHRVEVRHIEAETGAHRVHLLSPDSDELYFELGRYPETLPREAYAQFTADVAARIPGVEYTALESHAIGGHPGYTFSIRWPGYRRTILLLPAADALYRIVYNPESALNGEVLGTVRVMRDE